MLILLPIIFTDYFCHLLVSGCSNRQVFKRWIDQEPSPRHHVRFFLGDLEWWKKKDICVRKCFVHVVHLKCNHCISSLYINITLIFILELKTESQSFIDKGIPKLRVKLEKQIDEYQSNQMSSSGQMAK